MTERGERKRTSFLTERGREKEKFFDREGEKEKFFDREGEKEKFF